MTAIEKNTELFYNELNNRCDPDTLLNLAKKGIFLYEPLHKCDKIKNHEYVVDISLYSRQYFFILNQKKYKRLIECLENYELYNIFSYYNNKYSIIKLIIINDFFLKELLNEQNNLLIEDIIDGFEINYLLRYLYKFNIISSEMYYLFNINQVPNSLYEFMNYFYYNEENHIFNSNINECNLDRFYTILNLISLNGYDINMIKFCKNLFSKFNLKVPTNHIFYYKFPLNLPLDLYKKYSEKIYLKNKYIIRHENKYFENAINILMSDSLIYYITNNTDYFYDL
eukprot:jgi/Orpsp1_1/1181277/evm.model.c7180000076581.1